MKPKAVPQRRCIGCMESKDKKSLLRIVATEGGVKTDPSGKLPGRGAYVCFNPACAELAFKKKAFPRNLKTEITKEELEILADEIKKLTNNETSGGVA